MEDGRLIFGRKVLPGGKEATSNHEVYAAFLAVRLFSGAARRGRMSRRVFAGLVFELRKRPPATLSLAAITDPRDDVLDAFDRLERCRRRVDHPKIAFSV